MGVESTFDYDSVPENESSIIGHSSQANANIVYNHIKDGKGMVSPLTSCCNAASKYFGDDDQLRCKVCAKSVDPEIHDTYGTTDLLRDKEHPSKVIAKTFGSLSKPKPLEPGDQARVDQWQAERKNMVSNAHTSYKASKLSGICRKCSTLRDINGTCGCND